MPLFPTSYKPQFDNFRAPHLSELHNIRDYDLLSPCEFYRILDQECRKFTSETTAIWVTGERAKCDQWKDAFQNCGKWEESKDRAALENILNLERSLFKMRQVDIALNSVWELRDSAAPTAIEPAHFNACLPPFLRRPGMDEFAGEDASGVTNGKSAKAPAREKKVETGDDVKIQGEVKGKVEENCSIM